MSYYWDGKRIENDDDELNNNHLTLHTSKVMKKEKIQIQNKDMTEYV